MKWIISLILSLAACGLGLLGLYASPQTLGRSASGTPGESEPSPCLTEATIHLTANPTSVDLGQSSTVSWSVQLPTGCGGVQVKFNGQSVARSGSQVVTPPKTSNFTVTVSETHLGVYGQRSQSVQIRVSYPPVVVINPSTHDPVQVLIGALVDSTNEEQTVELCDVDLNLTGIKEINIGDNRSLIASPGCERTPRRLGPGIFVTDKRGSDPLFVIRGDNVRFSGFRLEGPTKDIAQGDVKEKGIQVSPSDCTPSETVEDVFQCAIHNIEFSNMEISHWSGAGIEVRDNANTQERGRLFNTYWIDSKHDNHVVGAVHIKNNFFHHNRHGAGFGYGVVVGAGAYALIEQNVFDENRHGIAGDSKDGADYSGYTLRDNLILADGGVHCSESWYFALVGWRWNCWHTQQIDMHGDQNEWYSSSNWECGTAGETMMIERNTILYTQGLAIKIRGNPADKVVVDGNVFKHKTPGDAIHQNGDCGGLESVLFGEPSPTKPIDVRPNNAFGVDPMAELGSCDFFGDGKQDQFMATGVTWWAKSPVTHQWRYLNTMPERLTELQLRKIDDDAVCDVAPRTRRPEELPAKYSKSGTSAWVPLRGHIVTP